MSTRVCAALAVLAVVLVATTQALGPPRPDGSSALSVGNALRWSEGRVQRYSVDIRSSMRLPSVAEAQAPSLDVGLVADLELATLEAGAGGALVGLQLSSVQLKIGPSEDLASDRSLDAPFRVRFVSGGVPSDFEFPSEVAADDRQILENLVRMFQVTMADDAKEWVAKETNGSGTFEAQYRREGLDTIRKTKMRFEPAASSPLLAAARVDSQEIIRIGTAHDWLTQMEVNETLRNERSPQAGIEIVSSGKLLYKGEGPTLKQRGAWAFVTAPTAPLAADESPAPLIGDAQRRLTDAVAALDAVSKGRGPLIHRLRDLVREHGELADRLLEVMRAKSVSDRTVADLYLVLELAGTVSAQSALASVLRDRSWSTKDTLRALVALADVEEPNEDTLVILWETASREDRSVASTAMYALGSVGRTLKRAERTDYTALRDQLRRGAAQASEAGRRAAFVQALGNTRDEAVTDDLASWLDDPASSVRRAAALSLGRVGRAGTAEVLVARFAEERSSEVRGAIAESMTAWPHVDSSSVDVISTALASESDERARFRMARFMAAHLSKYPEYRSQLTDMAKEEPSKRIRETIEEAVASIR